MPNYNSPQMFMNSPGYFPDDPTQMDMGGGTQDYGFGESMDVTAGMPSVDYGSLGLGSQGYRVPYDALSAMLGIDIPNMPDRDPQGRYGLTDAQTEEANNRGMASGFFGAAQSFMGGGPGPAMQGAMQAGDIRRGALDKFSAGNAADYEMRMKNAIANIELIKSRTAVEQNQAEVEKSYMALDGAKQLRAIGDAFLEANQPVAENYTAAAYKLSEGFGREVEGSFLEIAALVKKGDLAGADEKRNNIELRFASMDPTGKIAQEFDRDVKVATLEGLAKHKVEAGFIQNILNTPEFKDYGYELDANGNYKVVSPYEKEKRQAALDLTKSTTSENYAQAQRAAMFQGAQDRLKMPAIVKMTSAANSAFETLKRPRPVDPAKIPQYEKETAAARAALADIGLSADIPEDRAKWEGFKPLERQAWVQSQNMKTYMMMTGGGNPAMLAGAVGGAGGAGGYGMDPNGFSAIGKPISLAYGQGMVMKAAEAVRAGQDPMRILQALSQQNEQKLNGLIQQIKVDPSTGTTPAEKFNWLLKNYVSYVDPNQGNQTVIPE